MYRQKNNKLNIEFILIKKYKGKQTDSQLNHMLIT